MRLHELRNQVLAANFGGIHADFRSEHVHGAFDCGGGFGATRTSVCNDRRGVGDHRLGTTLDLWDRIDTAAHRASAGWCEHRADVDECAGVLNGFQSVGEHLAVARATDGDVLQLGTTVTERQHRFAARFAPAQWTTYGLRNAPEHDFFRVRRDLCSEPSANVGSDDAHVAGGIALVDLITHTLRVLRGDPLVQTTIHPRNCRTAHFEWARRHTLVDVATLHHHVTVGEELVAGDVGHSPHGGVHRNVAPGVGIDER